MTFKELVNQDKLVLVDFFATWCGPCKTMSPILAELKNRVGDLVSIVKIDVDKNPKVAAANQVQGVPMLVLYKNGLVVWKQSGVMMVNELEDVIRRNN